MKLKTRHDYTMPIGPQAMPSPIKQSKLFMEINDPERLGPRQSFAMKSKMIATQRSTKHNGPKSSERRFRQGHKTIGNCI
jgi:hypothetical protein